MPHASLLGSNGHHCAFTSQMISGHINVFIVLQKEGCGERGGGEGRGGGDRNTKIPCIRTRAYACPLGLSLKDATREEGGRQKKKKKPHTQVASRTHAAQALCAESGGQIEDQHHLEVTVPHCPVSDRNAPAGGGSLLSEVLFSDKREEF